MNQSRLLRAWRYWHPVSVRGEECPRCRKIVHTIVGARIHVRRVHRRP